MTGVSADDYRRMLADSMREIGRDGLQERVRRRVRDLGLYDFYYHTWSAKKSNPGYPDIHIIIPKGPPGGFRDVYMELKRQDPKKYQPSDDQRKWLNILSWLPGREVYLFRPLDLLDGTIDYVLTTGPLSDRFWRAQMDDGPQS